MLEIFCALYCEAKPIIDHLHLKKESALDSFVNQDRTIRLTLIGVGKIKAASTITKILENSEDTFVLSFGSSASIQEYIDGLYIANKITDIDTGISYYPDVLLKTNMKECGFVCGSQLYTVGRNTRESIRPFIELKEYLCELVEKDHSYGLYDMETSAVYEVCNQYIGPERMLFVRFASDNEAKSIRAKEITYHVEQFFPELNQLIDLILSLPIEEKQSMTTIEEKFSHHIYASTSIKNQIHQIVLYCRNAQIDYEAIMMEYLNIEVNSKEERKRVFNEFKKRCMEE